MMGSPLNININDKFHRWTVIGKGGKTKHNAIKWVCRCKCGTIKEVIGSDLKKGASKSCGCLQKEIVRGQCYKKMRLMPDEADFGMGWDF